MVALRTLPFLKHAGPALGFGFMLAFASSLGQTYFIALFGGQIRADLVLTHGTFGAIYTAATLTSGLALLWLGKLADRFDLPMLSIMTLLGLGGCAVLMAGTHSVTLLCLALFGLRLFGQGLLSHVMMTAMGRWFSAERGRALSVSTLGFPAGEALLPILVAVLLTVLTWRDIWLGAALGVVLLVVPAVYWLGQTVRARKLDQPQQSASTDDNAAEPQSWTRGQVLSDFRFYGLLPGILAPPFMITGVLFHQVHLVETKAWTLAMFAACYPLYALSASMVALGFGWLIDRYGTAALLPFYLLPLACGLAVAGFADGVYAAPVFMILMGATAGGATIILGALWAELYGTRHLGAIRSLSVALLVVSTAVAPGLMGWLIDFGIGLETQFVVMCAYLVAMSLVFAALLPVLATPKSPPSLTRPLVLP
ncbi:MAG: MFS transporter [Pseudomonadota bacterium]